MTDPSFHETANLFPLMDDAALAELATDIAANGLRDPIWRHKDGRIIDGRNRWLACAKAGVECRQRTYDRGDETIVAFVVSHNLHRRHLTTDQRAAIAAELATMKAGTRTDLGSKDTRSEPDNLSATDAANLLNVSVPSVKRAKAVKRAAPDLHEKVKAGEMTAGKARAEVKAREPTGTPEKGAPKMKDGLPKPKPRLRVAYDSNDGLVEQVFSLVHRLREVSEKTTPDALYGRVSDQLKHNLDRSLHNATEFLIGLRDAHEASVAEKKNAAG